MGDVRVPLTEEQRAKIKGASGRPRTGSTERDFASSPEQKDLRAQDTSVEAADLSADLSAQDTTIDSNDLSADLSAQDTTIDSNDLSADLSAQDTSIESDDMSVDSDSV
jgi:hypothetical protein